MGKKRYIVESWFRMEEVYDNRGIAERDFKRKQKGERYKDVTLIEITETRKTITSPKP